jgi:hypothetical protein
LELEEPDHVPPSDQYVQDKEGMMQVVGVGGAGLRGKRRGGGKVEVY